MSTPNVQLPTNATARNRIVDQASAYDAIGQTERDAFFQALLERTTRELGAQYGQLLLSMTDPGPMTYRYAIDDEAAESLPDIDWVEQYALMRETALQVSMPDFGDAGTGHPARHIRQVLASPILLQGAPAGVISVAYTHPPVQRDDELHTLTLIADALASVFIPSAVIPPRLLSLRHLEEYISQAPWPLALLDVNGRILSMNSAASELCARPLDHMRHRAFTDFLESDTSPAVHELLPTAILRRCDGTRVSIEMFTGNFTLIGGRRLTVLMLRDISLQKQVYEERLKGAELTGIFRTIATINHEINNPLFGMMATTQLLRELLRNESPAVQRKLDTLEECGERIKAITDTLSRVIRPTRRTYVANEGMLDLAQATVCGHDTVPTGTVDEEVMTDQDDGTPHQSQRFLP